MSVLEIWDALSGTSAPNPFSAAFAMELSDLLGQYCPNRALSILDLGAGSGNPAIGLALRGHNVKAIDIDRDMVQACRQRAKSAQVKMTVIHGDWLQLVHGATTMFSKTDKADCILCLGNALGYQDSWPTHDPAPALDTSRLSTIFRKWSELLTADGIIVLEIPDEPTEPLPLSYVRRFNGFDCESHNPRLRSIWVVTLSQDNVRSVDTMVTQCVDGVDIVLARIKFKGHVLTPSLVSEACSDGFFSLAGPYSIRPPLQTFVLMRAEGS